MTTYEARVELEISEAFDDDTLDNAFDKMIKSKVVLDPAMSSNEEIVGINYFVEATNATQAIDSGVNALLSVLPIDIVNVVVAEARPEDDGSFELISKSEIARRLNRSRERIRQLAQEGKLPAPVQTGRRGRDLYRWSDIKTWQERRTKHAAA